MDSARQTRTIDAAAAWTLLRACSSCGEPAGSALGLALVRGEVRRVGPNHPGALLRRDADGAWTATPSLPRALDDLLALYLPLCGPQSVVVAHLGQSLDGFVGTATGDSVFVNDAANIVHLHRMRALCDAVVVGGATVRDDDPRLTTRRVPGPSPVRVVIDPRRELDDRARVFTDGRAPTLRVSTVAVPHGDANGLRVARDPAGRPDLAALLRALEERGMRRVFVEGGGVTVSRFLEAGLLDRLQITVAPFIIGNGRPGLRLNGADNLADCPRPPHRLFRLGADVLFDLDLRAPGSAPVGDPREPVRM